MMKDGSMSPFWICFEQLREIALDVGLPHLEGQPLANAAPRGNLSSRPP
jgi:hypothetical protein